MPTCLNLSKSHITNDDITHISKALQYLARITETSDLALLLRLTRLAPATSAADASAFQLLRLPCLRWLDVSHTPLASIDSAKELASLKTAYLARIILVSNPNVMALALKALFKSNPQHAADAIEPHRLYFSIDPPLAERTWLRACQNQAFCRLEAASEAAATYYAVQSASKVLPFAALLLGLAALATAIAIAKPSRL
jgi:hypothetical protein